MLAKTFSQSIINSRFIRPTFSYQDFRINFVREVINHLFYTAKKQRRAILQIKYYSNKHDIKLAGRQRRKMRFYT